MKKIKVIVIGLGKVGLHYAFDNKRKQPASHVAAIINNPSLELVGICDLYNKTLVKFQSEYNKKIICEKDHFKLFEELEKKVTIVDFRKLDPFEKDHCMIIIKKTMSKVIIVDEKNQVIAAEEISYAVSRRLIRRVIRVMIFNENKVLLQKRSSSAYHFPNVWETTASGHVDEEETYEIAAKRELDEEVGIKGIPLQSIAHYYREETYKNCLLKSFETIFIGDHNGSFTIDEHEVSEAKWFSVSALEKMMKNKPEEFTPGLISDWKEWKPLRDL